MQIEIWLFVVIIVGALLVGGVAGFFISRKVFKSYLEKNPPIDERSIREMFRQMGRTPSEKQVRQILASMKNNK
ncbi:YneF family protein [Acholeplasma equirhinis]|uniref:YneF family protein n=1 Tax=Acholeplasma equirhinis TaxID=555393 RepID=UPI00197AF174|nr:YneF family protein [Acholeplasma equirhinis]MBN3490367.1 YneF family protein [Acholeplasma equirhinis]